MEVHTYTNQEILSDLFGRLPTHITNEFYNIMNDCLYHILEGMIATLISVYPEKDTPITEAIRSFEKEVEKKLDGSFNIFQDYLLSSILEIPPNLDITYYDVTGIRTDLTKEHEDSLDEDLQILQTKIINQKKLQHFLKKKLDNMENELSSLDEYSQILSFLSAIPEKYNVLDIQFSTEYVKEGLENLKTVILKTLPIVQERFNQMKADERTIEIRSIIQEQIKLINN